MTRKTRLHAESLDDRRLPSFSPATAYAAGTTPLAVATADFNNDGHLDLVSTGYSRVGVRLGDGAGGFGAAQEFATGWWDLSAIAVADFNTDAKPDLAVAHLNGCTLLLGNGDGTFQLGATTPGTSWGVSSFAVGDFDNDSNTDLVISGLDGDYSPVYTVRLGDGEGDFTPMFGDYLQGAGELVAVDLNTDGNLDVATANGYVLLGYGDGYFLSPYLEQGLVSAVAAAAGDFTGDGNADLVAVGDSVAVLRGDGNEGFHPPLYHSANGTTHTDVATTDFNADGKLDAVVTDSDTGTVSVMLGNGDGTLVFAGAFATAGSSPAAVTVGDFNGDGRPDVAVANAGTNTTAVLLNDGNWGAVPPVPPTLSISDATVTEGNTGTRTATFTVRLSAASAQTITVAYLTGNGTATAGSDYQSAGGTLRFAPGETTKTVIVPVNGDRIPEAAETFAVNLSGATNAAVGDGQGIGTILDDEPRISITDVNRLEGRKGQTTLFTFTVTLSVPGSTLGYDQPVTMSFRTANGSATTGNDDYVAKSGTLTFAPGETTKTITIEVKGDNKREQDEYFFLDLFGNGSNSFFTKSRGVGTILNDD
jgi:hypothetical protein